MTTLGEALAGRFSLKTGPFGTTLKASEYVVDGAPVVSVSEVGDGYLRIRPETPRVSEDTCARLAEYLLEPGDIVFARKGAVERTAWIRAGEAGYFLGSDGLRLRVDGSVSSRFLSYALRSARTRAWLLQNAGGSTLLSLNQETICRVPLTLPDLPTQTAIADLLGALDDKIAANDRVVASLDALVRAEVERYANGDTARIGELAQLGTQKWNGSDAPVAYLGLEHLPRRVLWPSEFGSSADVTSQKSHFEPGDLLFGKLRPYFHKVVVAPCAGVCSTDILVLRARDAALAGWMWAVVSSDSVVAAVTAGSTGTRMPRASWTELAEVSVPWPGRDRAVELSQMIEQLSAKARAAIAESRQLAATRDALLPELMSGRLGVLQSSR